MLCCAQLLGAATPLSRQRLAGIENGAIVPAHAHTHGGESTEGKAK